MDGLLTRPSSILPGRRFLTIYQRQPSSGVQRDAEWAGLAIREGIYVDHGGAYIPANGNLSARSDDA
jgi:hypothetical protein